MTGNSPRLDLGPATDRPSSPSLPPELAHEATRRLELLALVYAIGSVIEHVGHRALLGIRGRSGAVGLSGLLSGRADYGVGDALLVAAVAMGVAMWAISRFGRLSPSRLLDLGLVFQVAGALGIAAIRFAEAGPIRPDTAFGLVPSECIWIVAYPLVVPSVPRKALIGSLLAASAGPALLVTSAALRGTTVDRPLESAIYYVLTTYFSAISAYIVARIVHGYSMRLKHARDIGSYELIELLGEGGMGQVWRARHRLLARPAAIKLIRGDVLGANGRSRDALVRRFEREAQDTAMLGSPHTIDVYDFGVTEDGNFYYVMELLDGLNLERYMQLFGPMEPARVIYLLRQALHSLGEAHTRGLVHRDVKPANIFICRLGPDDDFVKVLDFGLVKHLDTSGVRSMLTMEGATAGTPAYMAPEAALGRPVDGRADLYAVGCVAYYLLTGRPVFSGDTPVATALAHVNDRPVPPSVVSEFDIPPELEAVILQCLAKDPADRPATASEVAQRLEAALTGARWTEDAAHAWWELHRARVSAVSDDSAHATGDVCGGPDQSHRRCWPRLDRKAALPPSVSVP